MSNIKIDGAVDNPIELTFDDLASLPNSAQFPDVSRIDPKRRGDAITLQGLLEVVRPQAGAEYLGLHSSSDDFHASIPLAPIVDRALLIYRVDGKPLDAKSGGPFRFYIPNHKACHTDEIDECANVKFVDRIELTRSKGFDNRPHDEQEHADLHARETP